MELTGTQKAAVLLLVLGDKFTAEVFKRMERREIAAISKAVIDLDTVSKDTVEDVLRTFHQDLVTGKDLIIGGQDSLKRMLMKNLDGETAKYIMD